MTVCLKTNAYSAFKRDEQHRGRPRLISIGRSKPEINLKFISIQSEKMTNQQNRVRVFSITKKSQ